MSYQQQVKMALGVFALFTLAFAINMFHLQPVDSGRVARGGAAGITALETAALRPSPAALSEPSAPQEGRPAPLPAPATLPLSHAVARELHNRGYLDGSERGSADIVTRAAIMAFEWDNGLPLTAMASETLLQSLILGAPTGGVPGSSTVAPAAAAEDVIRTVQQSLSLIGASGVKPDGLIGAGTMKAIKAFEARQGMPQTGRISAALVKRLIDLAGKGKLADRR